ncbi:MAG: universal stress protein [Myxococcales bacterium]|jgi:nucleotide-binding universal stress UspA family protein|nr:universal stress protein [Myxococcales bacterium]MBL9111274.1 universal stress protein [Myxococcales bacterium]
MKTILVALDNSPRAPEVLKAAIEAANAAPDAKLVLFRAVGIPPEMPGLIWQTDAPSLMDLLRDAAKKDLEAHAANVPANLRSEHLVSVEIGSPWQGICTAIEKEKADLLVIGSHGYGVVDRILGTTAAKVVNNASCSVLVVRPARAT